MTLSTAALATSAGVASFPFSLTTTIPAVPPVSDTFALEHQPQNARTAVSRQRSASLASFDALHALLAPTTLPTCLPTTPRTDAGRSNDEDSRPALSSQLEIAGPISSRDGGNVRGEIAEADELELEKRWEGWETSTSTVYVTATDQVPTAITIYTTYGESPVIDGGTTTETIYKGVSTLTVPGPSYLTLTFYPTTTTCETSRVTVPTATKTKTSTPSAAQQTADGVCKPGDADVKEKTGLVPTHDR
ncbi:hypothetical protein JCM10212_005311 [Sporobolomyces blumeae]